jgi:predicted Zn-dependent protease
MADGEKAPREANPSREAVGSSAFTLADNGRLPGGCGSTPYDGEGSATQPWVFVEKGLRTGFAHTSASAAGLGIESTGNAVRSDFAFPPRLGFHNLHLLATPGVPRDIVLEVREGLYLEDLWEPSSKDAQGRPAFEGWGFRIARGAKAEPVGNVRFEATLGDLLLRLSAVGPDLATFPGGLGGSTCLFEDVQIG